MLILALCACDEVEPVVEEQSKEKDGVIRKFAKDGSLKAEVNYKAGMKEGVAKDFYKDGQVHYEINYRDDVKNGVANWYYENGQLYMSCNYTDGELDGIETKYYESGIPMSEMPWKNKMPGLGLKEYSKKGKLLNSYPTIEFEIEDHVAMTGDYTIKVRLSNKAKNAKFWEGELHEGKYLNEFSVSPVYMENGEAIIHFHLDAGQYMMKKLNFIAKMKTYKRNYFVIQRSYNLAIDRKSF